MHNVLLDTTDVYDCTCLEYAHIPNDGYPRIEHITLASLLSHPLWQIVPQYPFTQISTVPSLGLLLRYPVRRTSPSVQLVGAVAVDM